MHTNLPRSLAVAALAGGALAGLTTAVAGADPKRVGTARVQYGTPAGLRNLPAHLEFPLAPGYSQLVGALGGNPRIGNFAAETTLADRTRCSRRLSIVGQERRRPLRVERGRIRLITGRQPGQGTRSKYLRVDRRGRAGRLRWYLGPTWSWPAGRPRAGAEIDAVAVVRTTSRLVPSAARWLVVTMELDARAGSGCTRARRLAIDQLPGMIHAVRLVAGRPGPARGVPVATA